MQVEPGKHKLSLVWHVFAHPSATFSCFVAINGVIGSKSDAALPELSTTFRMHPINDSIMYLTPCNFSSELNPFSVQISNEMIQSEEIQKYYLAT